MKYFAIAAVALLSAFAVVAQTDDAAPPPGAGIVSLLVIAAVVYVVFAVRKKWSKGKPRRVGRRSEADAQEGLRHLRALLNRAQFDELRAELQRAAYSISREGTPEERREFTAFVAEFARRDPLYRDLMSTVRPMVRDSPGILQSDLTKRLILYSPDQIRYVLYYAHEIGDLYRVKKGRSYALHLEPTTIDV